MRLPNVCEAPFMKPDTSRWRDHSSYDFLDNLSTEGLAWECLRRSRDYQQHYKLLVAKGTHGVPFEPEAQQRWGLRFPGKARSIRPEAIRVLVAARRSRRAYPGCCF